MLTRRTSGWLAGTLLGLFSLLPLPGMAAPPAGDVPVPPTPARAEAAPSDATRRPRLFLVLSGGGARGAAHIGILKVLEEMHVPVEMVVGTSMGSIVGGLYATGWTPDQMEALLRDIDWSRVFIDRVDRDEKTYRRRQDDSRFFIKAKIRFKGWKPYLPKGLLGGQRLELLLRSIEFESTGERQFDDFPIPYRAVAADLTANEPVVIDHGSLATAMRASMSIAGAFPPVELDGRLLVDGGAVANLPIRIAQDLGGEAVIAVDITSPLGGQDELGSFLSVMNQMTSLLTTGNRGEDLKKLRPQDVLIRPELGDITFSDFPRAAEAIAIGEKAARAVADRLRPYAVSDAEWAAYKARHHRRPAGDLVFDRVDIANQSLVGDDIVEANLPIIDGRAYERDAFMADMMQLYGLELFGVMSPSFERRPDGGHLALTVPPKPHSRSSLQLGLGFSSDLKGDSSSLITARHLVLPVNRRGGEWENTFQIGAQVGVATEFYQPLDATMRWFVVPAAHTTKSIQGLWTDGDRIADYSLKRYGASLDAGRVLGRWGDIRIGGYADRSRGHVVTGPEISPAYAETDGGVRLALGADTLDSTVFPTSGWRMRSEWAYSLDSFGAENPQNRAYVAALGAIGIGRSTLIPCVEIGDNFKTPVNFGSLFPLGGLWRLSGFGQNELLGERAGLVSLVFYREIIKVGLGALRTNVYAGASVELGGTFDAEDPITFDAMHNAGSIFVGADTVVGPAYVGVGFGEDGRTRYYVTIGQSF